MPGYLQVSTHWVSCAGRCWLHRTHAQAKPDPVIAPVQCRVADAHEHLQNTARSRQRTPCEQAQPARAPSDAGAASPHLAFQQFRHRHPLLSQAIPLVATTNFLILQNP